ncbi:MAG: amino acid permease [Acidobacteria bacterium]|nr:amino acid permease [Acidobacteriota bacterium]
MLADTAPSALHRRLGPYDGAAIVISNVIGSGIFFLPIIVAQMVPSPWLMLGAWLLGGMLAFAGAMAYAELAALRPRAGGEYVYLREAFGPIAAFLTGWTSFVAGFTGAIAVNSLALADYLGRFIPAAADRTPLLTIPIPAVPMIVSRQAIVALAVVTLLSIIHIRGLGPGRLVQNILAGGKVAGLVVLIALGLSIGRGDFGHLAQGAAASTGGFLLALIPVMFAYSGWNAAAYVAEEIRDPGRNVPKALGLGTVAVIGIYLLLNLLYLYAMPGADLAGLMGARLIDVVADRLFGFVAANVIAFFAIISLAASVSAMVLAGPRVYYAMARDGSFFSAAARVHPRYRTPAVAIVAQGIWSCVLILSGTLSQLVSYTGFAVVLFAMIAVLSLFVLRARHPDEPRPFRAWGYPVAPALFIMVSVAMLANAIWRSPGESLAGLAVIAGGLPLLFWFTRASAQTPARATKR